MEHGKVSFAVLAITVVLAGVSGRTWSADTEVPWVKPPPTIEQLTGGKVHTGDTITAANVDLVRPYLLESFARDITDGGTVTVAPSIPGRMLVPEPMIKATVQNVGKALLAADGTVRTTDGKPWVGGFPVAFPRDATQVMVDFLYCYLDQVRTEGHYYWVNPAGDTYKDTVNAVEEYYMNGRACAQPYGFVPGFENELRRDLVYYLAPYDLKGIAVLSIIYVDQSTLPDAWGYIPVLRRVQRFSSKQRYDSIDGSDFRSGDVNTFSDPLGFWTFKLVSRHPMLYPVEPTDFTLPQKTKELDFLKGKYIKGLNLQVRDCYLVEAVPKDPTHIYSKKILLIDAATYVGNGDFYDRQGKLWIGFHTVLAPLAGPCGNSIRPVAYPVHNYQTGSVGLSTIYFYLPDDPALKLDDLTLKRISTMSR